MVAILEVKEKKYMKRREPVDIESEFIGKPVGPKKKKEKKEDLTDEINKFLEEPSLEGVMKVLLRSLCISDDQRKNAKFMAYELDKGIYLIKITGVKGHRPFMWFMAPFHFIQLGYFSCEKWNSMLKQRFSHELRSFMLNEDLIKEVK